VCNPVPDHPDHIEVGVETPHPIRSHLKRASSAESTRNEKEGGRKVVFPSGSGFLPLGRCRDFSPRIHTTPPPRHFARWVSAYAPVRTDLPSTKRLVLLRYFPRSVSPGFARAKPGLAEATPGPAAQRQKQGFRRGGSGNPPCRMPLQRCSIRQGASPRPTTSPRIGQPRRRGRTNLKAPRTRPGRQRVRPPVERPNVDRPVGRLRRDPVHHRVGVAQVGRHDAA